MKEPSTALTFKFIRANYKEKTNSSLGFTGYEQVWLGLTGFDWVWLGLTGFDWVWLGLAGFLLGFNGFD